ncbi:MAG: polysaccharide biosynthesis/export family protein [Phycisphaerae bacterium]|nr:polysaccharide biosynthesis/export family protein [Phycisphaerae bacterium]
MKKSKVVLLSIILAGVLFMAQGCFMSNPEDIQAFTRPEAVDVTSDSYILQPPDEIEIQCTAVPEIHLQIQKIRPDGMVTFEGIGEVKAAGRTPKELADVIREKAIMLYALTGENPIAVKISVFESKWYYVVGEVYYEGPKPYTGRDTVLKGIAEARPNILAWSKRTQIIRPSANKDVAPKIFEVNYKDMIMRGDTSKNVLLQEGDIIYVPPTVLARIAMTIEEFLRPVGRAFSTVNIAPAAAK